MAKEKALSVLSDDGRPDLPPFSILALTPDQIKLLAVCPRVPWVDGEPDCRVWARMVQLPVPQVTEIVRGLREMGAFSEGGELHAHIKGYLVKLARDRLL